MRARAAVAVVVLLAALAGCTRSDPVNPNLLAPKLILDATVSSVPLVYVHSAFGERAYDRIELSIDNATRRVAEDAYSLEERVHETEAFLEVRVRYGESRFVFRGSYAMDLEEERVKVSTLNDDDSWGDPRTFALPYSTLLDREGGARS